MRSKTLLKVTLGALLAAIGTTSALAQTYVLTGTNYTENFDSIGNGNGLPNGWTVRTGNSATSLGALAVFRDATTNSWASTTGQFLNAASVTNYDGTVYTGTEAIAIQSNVVNRAVALRQTGAVGDPGGAFVFRIDNTLGFANFQLNLDTLMLNVQPRSAVWTVDYAVGNSPTSFTPLGTFGDTGVFGMTSRSYSFGTALDNQSENVWIRVVALNTTTGSGNRDTFGIDNFTLGWTTAPVVVNPPSIVNQPTGLTNNAGTTAIFTVNVTGTGPFTYQWSKDGTDIFDGGNISGANNAALNVSSILKVDEGSYKVVIANSVGSATSAVAFLKVIEPAFTTHPSGRTNVAGDTADFFAQVVGTSPIDFTWYRNGTPVLSGSTNSASPTNSFVFDISNVQPADQGNYTLVASNAVGVTTSSVAVLTIKATPAIKLARWDFNATNTLDGTAPVASFGTGTAAALGGTNGYFPTGSFSDPAGAPGADNSGWNTQYYPSSATVSNKTTGVQFNVSTVGHKDILITWEERHSNTASKYQRLQYSLNGVDFVDYDVITMNLINGSFGFFSSDLSSIPGVNNNPNFAFRLVAEFESTATGSGSASYVGTVGGSYGGGNSGGTIRYDLMTVFANVGSAPPSPIPLNVSYSGGNVTLTWTNAAFTLQSASDVSGTYTDVPSATSPYTTPASGAAKFFRLKF